jgi:hypothetical protein
MCHLRRNVESMIINKPVDIEPLEVVQGIHVCDVFGNKCVPKYWKQVHSAKDAVEMDDCDNRVSTSIKIRSNHPHPRVLVWLLRDVAEPVNYCTRIRNTEVHK